MANVLTQTQGLLLHPTSHMLLAVVLAGVALFTLVRHHYKNQPFKHVAVSVMSLGVMFYVEIQMNVLHTTKPPHYWLFGRDIPVYLLFVLSGAFAALSVWELVARRGWQGYTSLLLAAGTLALGAEITMYAYRWDKLGTSIVIGLMLLVALTMAAAAIGSYRSRLRPAPQPMRDI